MEVKYGLKEKSFAGYWDQNLRSLIISISAASAVFISVFTDYDVISDYFSNMREIGGQSLNLHYRVEFSDKLTATENMISMIRKMHGDEQNWQAEIRKKYDLLILDKDKYTARYRKLGINEDMIGHNRYSGNYVYQRNLILIP